MAMKTFEEEYYLLYPSDISVYPLIFEDCKRYTCSYEQYKECGEVPDCPAYSIKKDKIENPQPFILDFFTSISKNEVVYADFYLALSISETSFAVSPKFYDILLKMNIYGVQFIPVSLVEYDELPSAEYWYVHIYNFLPVLSVKNSIYQTVKGKKINNNILKIRFNNKTLGKIPLENRLIFRFPLKRSYFLFHESAAEKIAAAAPIGIQFIKISDMDFPNTGGFFI
jgi:hypothetical protein